MNSLIVMLDDDAPSFCYYQSERKQRVGSLMPIALLSEVVDHAIRNRLNLNFLCGNQVLPPDYQQLMDSVDHIRIVPVAQAATCDDAVLVIEAAHAKDCIDKLDAGELNNVILRVAKEDLCDLASTVTLLRGRFKRLNLILTGVENFDAAAFTLYESQLDEISGLLEDDFKQGGSPEMSIITDRIFLTDMNNCNAGIDHLTVAPNGRLYLCPAFYHEDKDNHVGNFASGTKIGNSHLLELDQAPICRNCDAYQCRRCVYLNKKLTSELNTPSHQQCVAAHVERNVSRRLLMRMGEDAFKDSRPSPIPGIDYLDPFEIINNRSIDPQQRQGHFAGLLSQPLERLPVKELLRQIHLLDPALLRKLKAIHQEAMAKEISDAVGD